MKAPGSPGALGVAREILTVEIGPSYYTDARAQRSDSHYGKVLRFNDDGTVQRLEREVYDHGNAAALRLDPRAVRPALGKHKLNNSHGAAFRRCRTRVLR